MVKLSFFFETAALLNFLTTGLTAILLYFRFMSNSPGVVGIFENAPGCNDATEVETACFCTFVDCSPSGTSNTANEDNQLIIYPNPATDVINLHFQEPTSAPLDVQIFDAQGRLLRHLILSDGQQLDVQGLAPGLYSLKAVLGGRVYVGKFVKQ